MKAEMPADYTAEQAVNDRNAILLQLDELTAHEHQTHERLGAILGTDDSLERCATRLKDKYDELREFVRLITLQLQQPEISKGKAVELFNYAYRMYQKHDVERRAGGGGAEHGERNGAQQSGPSSPNDGSSATAKEARPNV